MPNLCDLQRQFAAALLNDNPLLPPTVQGASGLDVAELMAIYRNNLFVTLRESLEVVFPVTRALVGDNFFTHMARRYIRAVPLTEGSVRHYGKGFADFIARQSDAAGLPYLPDMIRLEWIRQQVAEAPLPRRLFPYQRLGQLAPAQQAEVRFAFAPSWHRLNVGHPVLAIHTMVSQQAVEPLDLNQPEVIGLWRTAAGIQMQRLNPTTRTLVEGISQGQGLGQLLEHDADNVMPALQQAIQLGIVTDLRLEKDRADEPDHPPVSTQ